ncbi:Atu4866 domain-containing protein [Streptomyces sp. AD2-2]|nr:Atu4866 domain-containing protein [Streptomyces sp. AD2-2]
MTPGNAGDLLVVPDGRFWAFGEFRGDEPHHAGYAMRLGARVRS